MNDLLKDTNKAPQNQSYTAEDIEVLEGLEPVRKRPGMYIGGTDQRALHHLVIEVLDNSMDEAVAGHATRIDLKLNADGSVTIADNGRGIPVGKHPKYQDKSALEVIMTTLHSGGKFSDKSYNTSGGLHGVGISVVNALSTKTIVEVARDKKLYIQEFSRGKTVTPLQDHGVIHNRRGTSVTFWPDQEIFDSGIQFNPKILYEMARSKAYLFSGVEIRWKCDPRLINKDSNIPTEEKIYFPNGLLDFLNSQVQERPTLTASFFSGRNDLADNQGRVEWAIAWTEDENGFCHSYCNTISTPLGGTHESGLRTALTRGIKQYTDLIGEKGGSKITAEDVLGGASIILSVFVKDPQFQGQTKEKLVLKSTARAVEMAMKDPFDLWLGSNTAASKKLVENILERAAERQRKRNKKPLERKSATRRLRLPGKLSDCSRNSAEGTELFIVEGDSAGGSAKQARNRETQAILPLRGKILNVASASAQKLTANADIKTLATALGCGLGKDFNTDDLRYERIIIMTDADVDGAHIATLLITFFFKQCPGLIESGRLYLAMPPLYRLVQGKKSVYAQDDQHREELIDTLFDRNKKIDISRFKGLGEMPAASLKETTMHPEKRQLMRITLHSDDFEGPEPMQAKRLIDRLMGRKAEARFKFIQENAEFAKDIDV